MFWGKRLMKSGKTGLIIAAAFIGPGTVTTASMAGLSEAIVNISQNTFIKWFSITLVCAAIGVGNAAYEGGNLTGAALGLANVLPGSITLWALTLGSIALILLLSNRYHLVERVLIGLVALMSVVFIK
jgi:Mn2+/Fe2+ NRAMP family transporter